jgi:hypothetical protein
MIRRDDQSTGGVERLEVLCAIHPPERFGETNHPRPVEDPEGCLDVALQTPILVDRVQQRHGKFLESA